jgi:RNA polymerase primary sigma factor
MNSKRPLDPYFEEVAQQTTLSEEDEKKLAERIQAGDDSAVGKLAQANLRYVIYVAKQYRDRGLPLEDLISEGNVGLLKAAGKFDAARGTRFVSFASTYVRQAIEAAIDQQVGLFRVPQGERTNANEKQKMPRSIEAPIPEGSHNTISLLHVLADKDAPQADEQLSRSMDSELVARRLDRLDERERTVITAVYGIGTDRQTLAEIAGATGMKRERVRQIRDKALRKLKKEK